MVSAAKATREDLHPTGHNVYVYPLLVRIWHWATMLGIIVLGVTGYLIGKPPFSVGGEAWNTNVFGTVREVHFITAYIVSGLFVMRVIFAIFGGELLRQIFIIPIWSGEYWKGLWEDVKWYGFLRNTSPRHRGHNALAALSMNLGFVFPMIVLVATGFGLYSEGLGIGSWADRMFGWLFPLLGGSQGVRDVHHGAMWVVILFSIVHLYAVVREDIMGRQSMVSSMINGWRHYIDEGKDIK